MLWGLNILGKDNLSGKKKYNNGVISKYFIPGTEPEGWTLGSTTEKRLKNSEATKRLWKDSSFRESQSKTRSSKDYKESLSVRSKEMWNLKHDTICDSLKRSASKRWDSEEEHTKQSERMFKKWKDSDYRESQSLALKSGHKDIYSKHPEYLEKLSRGNSETWKKHKNEILEKQFISKSINKTWNTSKLEEDFYQKLLQTYSSDDIIRQYSDDRYPFYCDFYVKSIDKFIEIQGTWSHGGHPFNQNDPKDVEKLSTWEEMAITSDYYKKAIKVWTVTDPLKMKISKENKLNIEFIY